MPVFFLYLLKFSLSLAAVYLLYHVLLRRLTFYRWNRLYLLTYPLACFLIPLIDIAPLLQQEEETTAGIMTYVPLVQDMVQPTGGAAIAGGWKMIVAIVAVGMLVLLCRLLLQYFSLQQIKKQAVLLSNEGVRLYQVNRDIIPFSFANAIYINQHNHTQDELKEIIRHEYVHVKQRHSFDILLAELLCIINWYNPFAWLLRSAIRQNLEFAADHCVLESGVDKKAYQYLLLKVVGTPHFRIVNQFNFSSLKKRIVMMNKMKTARVHLVKFAFVLPLAAILLLAFREKIATGFNKATPTVPPIITSDTVPELKQDVLPSETQWNMAAGAAAEKAFRKRHPKVVRLAWAHVDDVKVSGDDATEKLAERFKPGPVLYVYLTNGKHEVYFLGNEDDNQRFKKNYGELPPVAPPPPPPPPPPAAPVPAAAPSPAEYPAPPPPPAAPPAFEAPTPLPVPAAPPAAYAPEDPAPAQAQAALEQKQAALEQEQAALEQKKASLEQKKATLEQKQGEHEQAKSALEEKKASLEQKKAGYNEAKAAMAPPPAAPPAPVKLPRHIKSIQINNKKATVTLRNGTVEKYDMSNAKDKATFQKKYGKLPDPPPAPAYPAAEKY